MSLLDDIGNEHKKSVLAEMSIQEYLELCKKDSTAYSSPAERLLAAIGEPTLTDTQDDPRLSRLFRNRTVKTWKCFEDFYGNEETIERLVSYFKHAAQNLEESKQILYLLGPVGGGKSSLARRIRELMETQPFYAIKGSPIFESPLSLFNKNRHGDKLEKEFGIPKSRLTHSPSPWLTKRLSESDGDLSKLRVIKVHPSIDKQVATAKTEPGDENNQDISCLVGKVDIRKLEKFSPNDPDAYSYSGALCLANRGVLEFVEMFKAPIKVLHPLLTATQDRNYNGTESIPSIPFDGIVLAHSNESEWESFKADKKNEAFIDRIYLVKVPYCLRIDEEVEILKKLIRESSLSKSPCAPKTLEMLAKFNVISRITVGSEDDVHIKARVYNGENMKLISNKSKPLHEYLESSPMIEGMKEGISPRFAFKVISKVFNYDVSEIAADPITLMEVLRESIVHEQFEKNKQAALLNCIKSVLHPTYNEYLYKEIQTAYLESYSDYGQNIFDRYITYADYWIRDLDFRDKDTGLVLNKDRLDRELQSIEQAAGIMNPHDFRHEVVNFVLRVRSTNGGKNPRWTEYEKLREVIEKKLFANTKDLMPIISFESKNSTDEEKKHKGFVDRMVEQGYTERQVKILVEYYIQNLHKKD